MPSVGWTDRLEHGDRQAKDPVTPVQGVRSRDDSGRSGIDRGVMTSAFAITTDEFLVGRARSGDLEALEAVYRAYEAPVYNLARRLCRRPEDAEDVLQETFIEVMRSVHRYRGDGSFAGWIRKVAASKALMKLRSAKLRETEELIEETAGTKRIRCT